MALTVAAINLFTPKTGTQEKTMSKIDYEITVDVRDLSVEERKKVQDAYFKLGVGWCIIGYKHAMTTLCDPKFYTNKMSDGNIGHYLMWSRYDDKTPTHTPQQLFELAGMEEQDVPVGMEPFDLERALAGDPVVTRDGCDVLEMYYFESSVETFRLYAVPDRPEQVVFSYNVEGRCALDGKNCDADLFMKKKTHIVNGFEVPAPETKAPNFGVTYFLAVPFAEMFFHAYEYDADYVDQRCLGRGLIFLNKDDAIANAKAMIGINPNS